MKWVVRGYERDGDALVVEIALKNADPEALRRAIGITSGESLVGAYPLAAPTLREVDAMFEWGSELDPEHLEYFLECDAS